MKKILLFLMSVVLFTACNGCSQPQEDVTLADKVKDSAVVINVEHTIALDRQTMYMKFGEDYRWWETEVHLPEFLNSENVTSNPEYVVNIFQSIVEKGNGFDTKVWKFRHYPDTVITDSIDGFWIENYALNEEVIKLEYTAAFERMLECNLPKPHSKNVILRNPIGPVAINAQWIFGNIHEQIWVDAVTGDTKNSNPAFPEEKGFKMPLGEWP